MHQLLRLVVLVLALNAAGCTLFETPEWAKRHADAKPVSKTPVEQPPIVSDRFVLSPAGDMDGDVVGEVQVIRARYEDTFVDIARAYDLGFDELVDANPGVDPWLPGAGTLVVLPTRFILPDAPRDGIVLNIGTKRIFFYPKVAAGESPVVITHPVGIGRDGWATPIGTTTVVAKVKDPVWTVPPSIRKEHADAGDPLPAQVKAGPDNPLGAFALRLGFPSYLIHGTNKPSGIGMRVSHGCVQLFPEDIESLFSEVAVGTPVRIVNQPRLVGWQAGNLYLEVHPALEDDQRNLQALLDKRLAEALRQRKSGAAQDVPQNVARKQGQKQSPKQGQNAVKVVPVGVDAGLVETTVKEARGFPIRLLESAADAQSVVARARVTENIVTYPVDSAAATDPQASQSTDMALP
jgi:L,D-transpeptidase ErfK/SrfK